MSTLTQTGQRVWITTGRAAAELGVSVHTVRELIGTGRLSVRHVPGAWPRVLAAEVRELAASSTTRRVPTVPPINQECHAS